MTVVNVLQIHTLAMDAEGKTENYTPTEDVMFR